MSKKDKINNNSTIWKRMWAEYEESIAGRRLRRKESKRRRKERKMEKMWKEAKKEVIFFRVFIGIFIPILVFTALLCLAGTMLLYYNKNTEIQNKYFANNQEIYHELCSVYEEIYDASDQNDDGKYDYEWISRVKWIITIGVEQYRMDFENSAIPSYILLVNKKDMSVAADSSMGFWMSFSEKNEKEKTNSFMRYYTANDALKKMAYDYDSLCVEYPNYSLGVELEDCYYKDDEMIPGKFAITDNSNKIYKEYDSTPEDTSKYIHITSKDYKLWGPVWIGDDHNELSQKLKNDTKLRDNVMIDVDSEIQSVSNCIQEGFDNYIYEIKNITSQDEEEGLQLIFLHRYNIVNLYGKKVLMIYIGILILALLLSLVIAYYSYFRYQAQLQMEQYRIDMTNMMAHDLKSPLMVISGYAENLRNNIHVEKKDYYAQAILENVGYMNTIIHNVLNLSKIESKSKRLQKEEVDLFRITKEHLEKYQEIIMSKGLKISFYKDGKKGDPKRFIISSKVGIEIDGNQDFDNEKEKIENVTILADAVFMEQIVENLISNAVKYTKEQGNIFITINQDYYEVWNLSAESIGIEVKDLWKPFVKGDNSRSGEQGSGIGLTIVKNIAEQQGFLLELAKEDGGFTARIRF